MDTHHFGQRQLTAKQLLRGESRDREDNINFFSINFIESQSGCSQKFMLRKVYVRNSLCFTVEKSLA